MAGYRVGLGARSSGGTPLNGNAELRAFEYAGAKSIKQPDLYVIYEVLEYEIVVKVVGYDEAKAASVGHA
jgi:hypothetical protein